MATFIYFLFPLADIRTLLPVQKKPVGPFWERAKPEKHFVRSFGKVGLRGGDDNPKLEKEQEPFANASHAIGSNAHLFDRQVIGRPNCQFSSKCYFRNLFAADEVVKRVEISFKLKNLNPKQHIASNDIQSALFELMDAQVKIPKRSKNINNCIFFQAGDLLARHYLRSTTQIKDKKLENTENWWVLRGIPLIYVEMHQDVQFGKLPGFDKKDFNSLKKGIKLSYILYTRKKTEIALWVLEKSSKFKGEKKYLRFLRRHILRLHSEWECFKDIDGLIKTGKIKEVLRDTANEKLKGYIFDVNELLLNLNHDKMPKNQDEYEVLKEAMNFLKEANSIKINSLISRREFYLKKDLGNLGSKNMNTNLSKTKQEVFIVHGHDKEKALETARFLEKLHLKCTILHEQPGASRTIIKKFEDCSNVDFAVVLLTPDDKGGEKSKNYQNQMPRARQNVIFELGYFIGKLGRDRVCALRSPGVEIPSDYSGVEYIEFDEKGAWCLKLGKEMKAAGLNVDLNLL